MLGCPCKIIKPFTFATTKKTSVLRGNSVVRMPVACYCTKGVVFLHIVRSRQFSRREWDTRKPFFREQKNFIWTSLLFWKNKGDKEVAPNLDEMREANTDKKKSSYIFGTDKLISVPQRPPDKVEPISVARESIVKSAAEIKPILDGKTNQDGKKRNVGSAGIESHTKQEVEDTIKKTKYKYSKVIDLATLRTEDPCEDKHDHDNGGLRQVHDLNLGSVNKNTVLPESPNVFDSESGRTTDTVSAIRDKTFKDTPQKFFEKAKSLLRKTPQLSGQAERVAESIDLGVPKESGVEPSTRRRQTVDLNRCSTERNFITPVRAMTDFLLKPSDLEGLRKTKRRSPYENDPPITVYWRKDVEAKAIDVWGSKENLLKEILKRDIERRRYQQNLFTVKRRLRDYRREQGRDSEIKLEKNGLFGSSGKVVLSAIAINATNFIFKCTAWLYTGSHSMFSETVHSLADTINQLILAYGIHKSVQKADSAHPYGYTNMRYVASLISGVAIFCVGSGLSFYHGVVGLTDPADLPSFYWAYFILLGSLASEGATLLIAFNSVRVGARKSDMSFSDYVFRGQDPSVNVVLLEDTAAVIGVAFAGTCMGLSSYYDSNIPDAIGSILVGGLLGCVASFIIYTNVAALVGRSIPQERLDKINAELEADVMIRAIHDVKGIDIGNSLVRYKAEMDFDGGELTRSYLDKQDLNQMLEEVRKMQTIDELEEFMLKHGENIVDMMGGEIDRIELKLRKKHPEIRHCDLEIL